MESCARILGERSIFYLTGTNKFQTQKQYQGITGNFLYRADHSGWRVAKKDSMEKLSRVVDLFRMFACFAQLRDRPTSELDPVDLYAVSVELSRSYRCGMRN